MYIITEMADLSKQCAKCYRDVLE